METTTQNVPQNTPPAGSSVPRAVWIGGGLLCLVTAGLSGALITRSVAPAPTDTVASEAKSSTGAPPAAAACPNCGIVESVTAVKQKGQGTGVGAVTGGVLGGVVGNQFGSGGGRTAMTVIGAVGGGLAGHEVEKQARSQTNFSVTVRMNDGSTRTFRQAQSMAVGAQVRVDGNALSVVQKNPQ